MIFIVRYLAYRKQVIQIISAMRAYELDLADNHDIINLIICLERAAQNSRQAVLSAKMANRPAIIAKNRHARACTFLYRPIDQITGALVAYVYASARCAKFSAINFKPKFTRSAPLHFT